MPPRIIAARNLDGDNFFLNYPKYTKNLDSNTHVRVFKQVIRINGVTQEGTQIVYFQWMLWDTILTWEDNFGNSYPKCTFSEFGQALYK